MQPCSGGYQEAALDLANLTRLPGPQKSGGLCGCAFTLPNNGWCLDRESLHEVFTGLMDLPKRVLRIHQLRRPLFGKHTLWGPEIWMSLKRWWAKGVILRLWTPPPQKAKCGWESPPCPGRKAWTSQCREKAQLQSCSLKAKWGLESLWILKLCTMCKLKHVFSPFSYTLIWISIVLSLSLNQINTVLSLREGT